MPIIQRSINLTVPTTVPFNDLKRLYTRFGGRLEASVLSSMRSGWWISGKAGETFAESFAQYIGTSHCIPVANGTDALEIALRAAGQAGDEIITVANAGGYTSTAARQANFIPIFADVEPQTLLMSIASAVAKIGNKTAAIVVTHLFGNVVDVLELRRAMDRAGFENVRIIEDCAQAHGAHLNGKKVGSLGDLSTFSFYPTKNLGALGDAGAVLSNNDFLADAVRKMKQYGWGKKYQIVRSDGRNSRMDEIQAATLSVLLPELPSLNEERRSIRATYERELPDQLRLVQNAPGAVAHLVVAMTDRRDALRAHLDDQGIGTDIHYPVLDCDQSGWGEMETAGLPVSRQAKDKILSLPCFVGMTEPEQVHVCAAINAFFTT